jgi:hypothetical protein
MISKAGANIVGSAKISILSKEIENNQLEKSATSAINSASAAAAAAAAMAQWLAVARLGVNNVGWRRSPW